MSRVQIRNLVCGHCESEYSPGNYDCPHCCEHDPDPDEGYHCLNCGKDCSEDVLARAYDRAEGER